MTDIVTSYWFKSSHSGGSGTECVECAHTDRGTLIRDSKFTEGDLILVRYQAWREFIEALKYIAL
ncbi:DUF397 domain-containing protein [Streptomyces phaeolivaceus]|uniref:DUF397 domain-containing protein n=1 Tax=Streptomyces phaeolivaceus TaxID=2653200 RepID=A0A5P8K3Q5_9ACTN|nr:DUF397 domain-containing protein [Streptomyces phaeolivaceus]QFQ97684.1 DUF397 domain-containing protein [Streptomyces phaeolivaceus]